MRTAYDLLHRSNPNIGYIDKRGTFDTMLEAAREVTSPTDWRPTPNRGHWFYDAGLDDQWLIVERQIPETDAERIQLALELIGAYGQTDGGHHKAWVIDQTARLLTGDGYEAWVAEWCDGEDGPDTYTWDEGIAP